MDDVAPVGNQDATEYVAYIAKQSSASVAYISGAPTVAGRSLDPTATICCTLEKSSVYKL
jgi:hypothetical protein